MCRTSFKRVFWEGRGSVSATCELQFRGACSFVPLVFKQEGSFVCALSGFNSGVLEKKLKSRKDHPSLEEQFIFLLKCCLYAKVLSHREFCVSITPLLCVFDFISLPLISLSGFGKLLTVHLTQQPWKQFWILCMSHCTEGKRMKRNKCRQKRSC